MIYPFLATTTYNSCGQSVNSWPQQAIWVTTNGDIKSAESRIYRPLHRRHAHLASSIDVPAWPIDAGAVCSSGVFTRKQPGPCRRRRLVGTACYSWVEANPCLGCGISPMCSPVISCESHAVARNRVQRRMRVSPETRLDSVRVGRHCVNTLSQTTVLYDPLAIQLSPACQECVG